MGNLLNLLLVEDDKGDVILIKKALSKDKFAVNINVVEDGEAAVSFLTKAENFKDTPDIDLILLDINLPKMSGIEVLKTIKGIDSTKRIPVVMLTTSDDSRHIKEAYDNGANCYISKPVNMEQFKKVVHEIENFWFTIVHLPK